MLAAANFYKGDAEMSKGKDRKRIKTRERKAEKRLERRKKAHKDFSSDIPIGSVPDSDPETEPGSDLGEELPGSIDGEDDDKDEDEDRASSADIREVLSVDTPPIQGAPEVSSNDSAGGEETPGLDEKHSEGAEDTAESFPLQLVEPQRNVVELSARGRTFNSEGSRVPMKESPVEGALRREILEEPPEGFPPESRDESLSRVCPHCKRKLTRVVLVRESLSGMTTSREESVVPWCDCGDSPRLKSSS